LSGLVTNGAVTLDLEFDPAAVTVDAVQRAAYRVSDRLSIDLQTGPTIRVTIHATDVGAADELAGTFRNEVLDQVLRERIRDETEAARNVILALAFSNTDVLTEG
jgi:His-Xaa-Ser system protein HxsD